MNDVILQIKELLSTNLINEFEPRRVEIGLYQDSYTLFANQDYPAVLVEPVDAPIKVSVWANNLEKVYSIRIYTIFELMNPQKSRVHLAPLQSKTLSEFTNEIVRILGTDKTLGGTVQRQLDTFAIESFSDLNGRQVESISVKYIDETIPWESGTINQSNMIKQP